MIPMKQFKNYNCPYCKKREEQLNISNREGSVACEIHLLRHELKEFFKYVKNNM